MPEALWKLPGMKIFDRRFAHSESSISYERVLLMQREGFTIQVATSFRIFEQAVNQLTQINIIPSIGRIGCKEWSE
ncbi:hypothetical protein AAC387_Pa02g3885 [Persea americana]